MDGFKTPRVSFVTYRHAFTLTKSKKEKVKSVYWISWDTNWTEICLFLNLLSTRSLGLGLVNSEADCPMWTARCMLYFKLRGQYLKFVELQLLVQNTSQCDNANWKAENYILFVVIGLQLDVGGFSLSNWNLIRGGSRVGARKWCLRRTVLSPPPPPPHMWQVGFEIACIRLLTDTECSKINATCRECMLLCNVSSKIE